MTGGRVNGDERAVSSVAVGQSGHAITHGLLGQRLQMGVECCIDAQPRATVQQLWVVGGLKHLPHVDDKVGRGGDVEPRRFELVIAYLGGRCLNLVLADVAILDHQPQHILLAGESLVVAAGKNVISGR